jgi:hypothetical protein
MSIDDGKSNEINSKATETLIASTGSASVTDALSKPIAKGSSGTYSKIIKEMIRRFKND